MIDLIYTKKNGEKVKVRSYNIRDDKNGFPHFLVFIDNEWKYVSAKYCRPIKDVYVDRDEHIIETIPDGLFD